MNIGPLINAAGLKKVEEQVEDCVSKGASVLCGGKKRSVCVCVCACVYLRVCVYVCVCECVGMSVCM